ncbi:MmyB family transcriptional regulator [Streptomyces decoyicus]
MDDHRASVAGPDGGGYRFTDGLVGPLTLTDELLTLSDDPGKRVVIYHAEPGSESAAALGLLAAVARGGTVTVPSPRT